MFPPPGSLAVSRHTGITLRPVSPASLGALSVRGSHSSVHEGTVYWSSDGTAAMWVPEEPFAPGETLTVTTGLAVRGADQGVAELRVALTPRAPRAEPSSNSQPAPTKLPPSDTQHFVTRPDLKAPKLRVVTPATRTAPGYVFLTPNGSSVQQGPLIVDDAGNVVWDSPLPSDHAIDFAAQHYQGQPVLTWFEGVISPLGGGRGSYVIMDQSYHQIARVAAGNGYVGDHHDFQITARSTALFTVYNAVTIDATSVGGSKHQTVLDAIVQEVDIPTGVVLFEWHSLGTIALAESYQQPPHGGKAYNYVHTNSIDVEPDDNLLVSGRDTFAWYKIDRVTGALIWRLGGKRSNFTIGRGAQTAWQHDVRSLGDGLFSAFDNGAVKGTITHRHTRGVVLRVDETKMSATLVKAYPPPQRLLATSQGNFQRLPNGNYFTGWGSEPRYTEFNAAGNIVYDVKLPIVDKRTFLNSYRAYRFEWHGTPSDQPVAVARRGTGTDRMRVWVSWNGATDVASWQVLGGIGPDALQPLASARRTGFETTITTSTTTPYVAVQALDASDHILATSALVSPSS